MPYLDSAGAALPSAQQMDEISKLMSSLLLANPHSHHTTALKTKQLVDAARLRVLQHFNASFTEYAVVFTSNTTSGLKIIAENFDFGKKPEKEVEKIEKTLKKKSSQFVYMRDAHHSVVGLRHIVRDKVHFISCIEDEELLKEIPETNNSLFVFTAMSNFCGKKYSLDTISKFQKKGWAICVDVASLVSTSHFDLSIYKPDFVVFSFYKIFGFPTGVGALLIKKSSISQLPRKSFAGGTVQNVNEENFYFVSKSFESGFEEGTLNYYDISYLQKGFEEIERCKGIKKIEEKTHKLASAAFYMLNSKFHKNGAKAIEIYNQSTKFESSSKQGPIITFNIKRPDYGYYGYHEVQKICAIFGIEVRTGCFCNIGACKKYLKLSFEMIHENTRMGKRCGDEMDLIDGKPTGAIRISFGRHSNFKDIEALNNMLNLCFLEVSKIGLGFSTNLKIEDYHPKISEMYVYPIKSCLGIKKTKFELTKTGFKHDREFMIVQNDITLNLKSHPELCQLEPKIENGRLSISAFDKKQNLVIPLDVEVENKEEKLVCHNCVSTNDCGLNAGQWFDKALDLSNCRLMKTSNDSTRSFVNDSPYLLINESSVYILSQLTNLQLTEVINRFRPNIVIRGLPPFIEDTARTLIINNIEFEVVGKCNRCEMICIDSFSGQKNPSLLLALRDFRSKQKITFGIYIRQKNFESGKFLEIEDEISF